MARRRRRRRRQPPGAQLGETLLLVVLLAGGLWQTPAGRAAVVAAVAVVAAGGVGVWWWRTRDRRLWRRTNTLGQFLALSPDGFEHAVAGLLRDAGWRRVKVSGGAGDLQADVAGVTPDGRRAVVQCKRYRPGRNVSSPDVQSFIGMKKVEHRACLGVYVTTSSFTGPARELATRHGLLLIDGDDLADGDITARLATVGAVAG